MAIFKIDVQGTIAQNDIFQWGFFGERDGDVFQASGQVAAAIPALVNTLWSGSVKWSKVRATEINEATGQAVSVAESPVGTITSLGAPPLPPGVSVCVTLRPVTGLITGRFYLPPLTNGDVDANGNMLATTQATLADRLQTFFQSTLGGASTPLRVGIYSRKNHDYTAASRLEVGSVYDSQRRRRNKLVETRLSRGLT